MIQSASQMISSRLITIYRVSSRKTTPAADILNIAF